MRDENEMMIRPSTHKELAAYFGVSWKTLQKWVKAIEHVIGKKQGHFYSAKQVAAIFEFYGYPKSMAQGS